MTFFWHDYETFGRAPRRDRPAQFAGVRTDADLNEIEPPLNWYCQPAPDYLPEPEACLLTGLTPQYCEQHGMPEYQFAAAIERDLSVPGTIGVGYNTIRFDDEVTRFLFWRNLMDPYAREWQNDCGRWDILDVVRATWALRPEGIHWPEHEVGQPSFKLEDLSAANGLAHATAHDALSDVRATISLARLIKQQQPRLWDFCLKLRAKQEVLREIGVGRPFLHISGMYGAARGCMAIVWPLAPHPVNKNEIVVWDLAHDPAELFELSAAQLQARLFVKAQDLPQGESRLPIKTIHINRSPIVIGNFHRLLGDRASSFGIDTAVALKHATVLHDRGAQLAGIWPEVFAPRSVAEAPDVDEDLYGGFLSGEDRQLLQRLRALPPQEAGQRTWAFADERLEVLWFRYRARNFPQYLSADETQRWQAHCIARHHHGQGSSLKVTDFFERLDALHAVTDEAAQGVLEALYDYAERVVPSQ